MSSTEDVNWFKSKFSWYTAVLSGAFGVCVTLDVLHMRDSNEAAQNMLRGLAPESSRVEDISSVNGWAMLATLILAGVVFAGSVFHIWCKLFMACRREKFSNGEQDCCSNSACCFSLLSVSRLTMNVVHAFCIMAIWWFALLLSVQTLMVHIFWHIKNGAQLQNSDQAAQAFTADTSAWMQQREEKLSNVIFNMSGYCSRVQCGTTITSAMETLEALRKDTSDISTALGAEQGNICPAVGCMKLDFLWFLKSDMCLCDQDGIVRLHDEALEGEDSARLSLYFTAACLALLVLLLSKMSANLKSLVKDDHWMQRIELVLDRLGRTDIKGQDSIVEIMQDASMSNYVWAQQNAAAPGNPTFGLYGGFGGGMGAKAAIAPPSSGADEAHDAIAASRGAGENTIDGAHQGTDRFPEAHL